MTMTSEKIILVVPNVYQICAQYQELNPESVLCHGLLLSCENQDEMDYNGWEKAHAWIEIEKEWVYDVLTEKKYRASEFYKLTCVSHVVGYSREIASILIEATGNFGPWDKTVKSSKYW